MDHLLLLHGALGHSSHFEPFLPFLREHFQVHTPLFRGHGGTGIPTSGLSIESYVMQVAAYLQEQQLERVHIFGYSMGGYVALCYAQQQPERVASLLTLATKLHWNPGSVQQEVKMLHPDTIREKVPKYAAQLEALHGTEWPALLTGIAGLMTRLGEQPLLNETVYRSVQTPVRLMVGDQDTMVSIDETRSAVQQIPGATFAVLPGTKHPIDRVRTSLLIDLMKDFWQI